MTTDRIAQGVPEAIVMTKTETLEAQRDDLELAIAEIRSQIERAKAIRMETGTYADIGWYNAAKHALRMKGVEHQRVLRELSRMKKAEARAKLGIAEYFLAIAREQLEPEDFKEMWDEALERKARAEAAMVDA